MSTIMQSVMKDYDRLVKELDSILDGKRISYAQFALKQGIRSVSFYNRYKLYGFSLEEMTEFVADAKMLPPNMIQCIKCGREFIPMAKSVKRAMCETCREGARMKNSASDAHKFKYPNWVRAVNNAEIKKLVEQEFHIDEAIAHEMANAANLAEAKSIRADYWQGSYSGRDSLMSLMNIR